MTLSASIKKAMLIAAPVLFVVSAQASAQTSGVGTTPPPSSTAETTTGSDPGQTTGDQVVKKNGKRRHVNSAPATNDSRSSGAAHLPETTHPNSAIGAPTVDDNSPRDAGNAPSHQ